ncbi:MAG: PQQ-binding-like beta-propeller repeat protein [Fuerstiella sp.]|nr:PQQ-binding-like beta-propeller repeat protein [Fuerstiella sp.]
MLTPHPILAALLLASPVTAQPGTDTTVVELPVEALLHSLNDALVDKRWLDAAQSFDAAWQLLHEGEDQTPEVRFAGTRTLRPGEHRMNAGARSQLRTIYQTAPPAFREEYQRQYDGSARRVLQEAMQQGDRQSLIRFVQRHENCDSSVAVVMHLVTDAIARGDFLNAVLMLQQAEKRSVVTSTEQQLLSAILWLRAGFVQESQQTVRQLAERIGYGSTARCGSQQFQLPESPDGIADWLTTRFSMNDRQNSSTWLQPQAYVSRMQPQQRARITEAWQQTIFHSRSNPEMSSILQGLERRILSTADETPISPAIPLVTNDLVIFQGVGNLQAVNRFNGEFVWESRRYNRQLLSALRWALTGDQPVGTRAFERIVRDAPRNHIRGQLASDGQLLFNVEETSQGQISFLEAAPADLQVQDFNVLRVYDLSTGRLRGQAGGLTPPADSSLRDPFAATCFLGTPLLLQNRILILAEDPHGIHLLDLGLESDSAAPDAELKFRILNRQLLSVPQYQLPIHPLRRYSGLTPSFSDGIVICHGCDEQVLGLAADDLSIEWVHRYRANVRPKEIGGGEPVFGNAMSDMDSVRRDTRSRPHDSFARSAGSRVMLMPRDSDQVLCLELHTGKEIWSKSRGDLRYVAALTDTLLVLAGPTRLVAVRHADGNIVWEHEFTDVRISAQPATTDRLIYLPTQKGHLLTVDITTGRRLLDQRICDSSAGNLLSVPGQLIAQNATRVTTWKPDEIFDDQELAMIEESLLSHEPDAAIRQLTRLVEKTPGDPHTRTLLTEQLLESIRLDYGQNRHQIPLLKRMISASAPTPAQIAKAVRAALGLTLHDAAVFAECWDTVRMADVHRNRLSRLIVQGLATQPNLTADELVTQITEIIPAVLTRPPRWLRAGSLMLLETNQTAATVQIAMSRLDTESRRRAVDLLRPAIRTIMEQRSDTQVYPNPLHFCWMAGLAECLMPLDEAVVDHLPALIQKAFVPQLLVSHNAGLLDANRARETLIGYVKESDVISEDVWTASDGPLRGPGNDDLGRITDLLRRSDKQSQTMTPQVQVGDAHAGNQQLIRAVHEASRNLIPVRGTPGVYRGWQFVRMHGRPGILAIDDQGRRRWVFNPEEGNAIQIRSNNRGLANEYAVACGRLLALTDNGRLYMLDAANGPPQVLWSIKLDQVLPAATGHQASIRGWQRTTVYDRQPDAYAPIGQLTEFGLPLFRGRRLVVLNPWTGQQMWIQDDLPDDSRLTADEDRLCVISESISQIQVRNLRDGAVQQSFPLPNWWAEGNSLYDTSVRHIELEAGTEYPWRIAVEGTRCLMFTVQPDSAMLTSYEFSSGTSTGPNVAWKAQLSTNSIFSNVSEGLIATLSDNNRLQIRQVSDGILTADQTVPHVADCERLYLRRSHNRLLVLTYAPTTDDENMIVNAAVPLNGPVFALDAQDGSIVWTGNAVGEYLRILNAQSSPTLPSAPLLILLSRKRRETPGSLGTTFGTRIIDVADGNVLYTDNDVGSNLSYHALRFDGNRKYTVNFNRRAIEFDFSGDQE